MKCKQPLIPLINFQNIQILTTKNWLDLGINTLAFSLEALLIKPGLAVLLNQTSLASYVGWPHEIWLVSSLGTDNIVLRSQFDGALIKHTSEEIKDLIQVLKPEKIVPFERFNELNISDRPLKLAMEGKIITRASDLSVLEASCKTQFTSLQEGCECPSCQLKLTRAYLHHLWFEVPALCQRYMAMHNLWSSSNDLG
jgi:hypothetical protein